MTIQEAIKSGKPFKRHGSAGAKYGWLVLCGHHGLQIGYNRKKDASESGGKTGDFWYIDLDVNDILADDWETKP